jgi:exopolyphosphatase/guanosine-5'-triphosphate,3'-diphosphate pyrophosphatase
MEQKRLSLLTLSHRGAISKARESMVEPTDFALLFALRLATLFHRSRSDIELPKMEVRMSNTEFELFIEEGWLERNPLTDTALSTEIEEWVTFGFNFHITGELENKKISRTPKAAGSTTGT